MAITWKKLAYAIEVIANALLSGKGDMIYASGAGVPARLPIGTDNYILRVATDVPAWEAIGDPAAHALSAHSPAVAALDCGYQLVNYLLVQTVVNEAALPATVGTAKVGQICWATGELSLHVCTVSEA